VNQMKTQLFIAIVFVLLCFSTCFALGGRAQTIDIGTVVINENLTSTDTFDVFFSKRSLL
jgi:hypothetical protein